MENPVSERMRDYEIERAVKEREKSLFEEELINYQKEIRKRALKILKNKDPIGYIIKIHQKLHIGNEGVAKLLLLSIGSQFMEDSNGLQVSISGSPGKGKTHCCRSMLRLIFKEDVLDESLSDKAAFYDADLKNAGTIIFIDDAAISRDLNYTIKKTMSNFQNESIHKRTLGINTIRNSIPPRTVWWFTSVSEKYSEELLNRMFKIKIDESPEQDKRVNDYQKKITKTGNRKLPTDEEIEICREIIRIIKSEGLFKTRFPHTDLIKFNNIRDNRKIDMFFDIMNAFSVFNYKQRKTDDENYLIVDYNGDFVNAVNFYNEYGVTHYFELTEQEIIMCEFLQHEGYRSGITEIANFMKISVTRTRQILNRIEEEFYGLGVFSRCKDKRGCGKIFFAH